MKQEDFFPSKYIKAAELPDDGKDFVMGVVEAAKFTQNGVEETKPVLKFEGEAKGLVLNKTNWNTIVQNTGETDSTNWEGTAIHLHPAMVEFQGKQVLSIRVTADLTSALDAARAAAGSTSTAPEKNDGNSENTESSDKSEDDVPF